MKLVDLTHLIDHEMPVYPNTLPPEITKPFTVIKDGFEETQLNIFSHVGTHIDAPRHMIRDGKSLDEYPIDQFIGPAKMIDINHFNEMDEATLINTFSSIDFVVLKTNKSEDWGSLDYFVYPIPKLEKLKILSQLKIKGIAIDAISVDALDPKSFSNHFFIFENEWIIIENLTDLGHLPKEFELHALPLKFNHSDGAPARVVAKFEE